LPFLREMSGPSALSVAALAGAVLCSYSVTVTIAIISEVRAKGSLTEFLLAFVVIGDLLVLVGFAVAVAATRATFGGHLSVRELGADVGWELFGSIAVGALLGWCMRLFLRRVGRDVPLFVGATCFLSAELGLQFHLSPLLTSLAAGAFLANAAVQEVHRVAAATETVSLPVFAVFFAAAGASLHFDALRVMGPVALVVVLVRWLATLGATRLAISRREPVLRRSLWMGLVSQAGVTFGLAAIVSRTFPGFGPQLETLFIAIISIHELIGPVLTRRALSDAGEVGAAAVPDRV
jgi:Kef-type K+ transport system membrane component KefB